MSNASPGFGVKDTQVSFVDVFNHLNNRSDTCRR